MLNIQSKIKGALYGFAIGDAMGATTEFMNENSIKSKYGKVTDIIGGGWLKLQPGEVTDDTQMTLCVCDAIEYGFGEKRMWSAREHESKEAAMLDRCCENFVDWYLSNPPDIGCCISNVISKGIATPKHDVWSSIASNPDSLGNGSLMRTMPIILSGLSKETAMLQGRLTHNNKTCDIAIELYYENLMAILNGDDFRNPASKPINNSGHVIHTLNNALYYTQATRTFEEAIIKAVNAGGDADTIAAITGSLVGALYGYEAIPQRWIDQLDPVVKKQINYYAKIFEKIYKKVCTNTK